MPQSLVLPILKSLALPFTLSHVAFSLPIKRIFEQRISTTGLVIGSMLPDVEYYLRMTMYGTWGHTWKGNVFYEVPIGIIIAFVFHLVIRDPLIINLPQNWSSRVSKYVGFNWNLYFRKNWFCVCYSLYIGVLSHMLLDIFTHERGYIFGIGWKILDSVIGGIPLYDWNQLILSVVGLALLIMLFLLKAKSSESIQVSAFSKLKYWSVFLLSFALIYVLRVFAGIPEEKVIIQHMVIFCSAASISLLITSVVSTLSKR